MPRKITLVLFVACASLVVAAAGCRKDGTTPPSAASPTASTSAKPGAPQASSVNEVVLRIRKLGGADGKQLMNQMTVATPIGDDFTITEQVGAKQLEFRGKVIDLKDGTYRVNYDYTETSADGRQQLKSLIEMRANTETEIGGVQGAAATETLVLSLSRP